MREHDIIELTRISLKSSTNLNINLPLIQGTSEGFETLELEYLTRRIQICRGYFCWDPVFTCFKKKTPQIHFTKTVTEDLNSPRRELSNGGLRIVVTLLVCWEIDFLCVLADRQSGCTTSKQ